MVHPEGNGSESRFGRYTRSFALANQKTRMTFDVDDSLAGGTQLAKVASLAVTYYDKGYDTWGITVAIESPSSSSGSTGYMLTDFTTANANTSMWQTVNMNLTKKEE